MSHKLFIAILSTLVSLQCFAGSDFLAKQVITFKASNPGDVLDKTLGRLRTLFENYEVALDSGTTVLSPLQVGGTESHPTLKASVEKCVFIVCKQVDLDAVVSVRSGSGSCDRNIEMDIDMTRSTPDLTEVYDHILVSGCSKKINGGAEVTFTASAHQGANYSQGMIQNELIGFLKNQVPSIVKAIKTTLKANGGQAL